MSRPNESAAVTTRAALTHAARAGAAATRAAVERVAAKAATAGRATAVPRHASRRGPLAAATAPPPARRRRASPPPAGRPAIPPPATRVSAATPAPVSVPLHGTRTEPVVPRPAAAPRRRGLHRRPEHATGFRGDIEGLRAIAVGLVVAFHAGVGAVSGGYVGVDVFFVLSGFLITGLLVDELRRTGTVSLRTFWARRARRLLPMSTLVLVTTAIASYLILPPLDHGGVAADVRASALYVANWHFAAESTQYMADTDKSPVLHYWSLAVEEQFYIVWPLLLLLLARGVRGSRSRWLITSRRIAVALGLIGVVSFGLSVVLTSTSGSYAYFGLHTRAWELAAGGGLALAGSLLLRVPRMLAVLAGWSGLALVVFSAFALDERTPFPGSAAALPVLGTVLLVAAGQRVNTAGVAKLLAAPALRYVGRISYSWYLWHWPCLILAAAIGGNAAAAVEEGEAPAPTSAAVVVLAVVVSFALAAASHKLLELPVRTSRWLAAPRGRSLALGGALTVASVVVASGLVVPAFTNAPSDGGTSPTLAAASLQPIQSDPERAARSRPERVETTAARGAVVLAGPDAKKTSLTPSEARKDRLTNALLDGCFVASSDASAGEDCVFGDPAGDRVVALLGDSHAMHWLPALDRLGKERGWQVRFWGKAGCPIMDIEVVRRGRVDDEVCARWRAEVQKRLAETEGIDAVVLARVSFYVDRLLDEGDRVSAVDAGPHWESAARRTFGAMKAHAPSIVVIRDVPIPPVDVPACLSEAPDNLRRCDFPRKEAIHRDATLAAAEKRAARGLSGVSFVDMTEDICPVDPCPAVTRDGTVMYRDDDHISASFSARLWEALGRELDPILSR